ncbi:MAG: Trypsin-like peptidase domain [Pseudomonadota bacterium]|jgi:hypothetical protein
MKLLSRPLMFAFLLLSAPTAWAMPNSVSVLSLWNPRSAFVTASGAADYQLGDEWGKKPVTAEQLAQETPGFVRMAKATASYAGGGTAFYLGKFAGKHLMGTNHHVQPSMSCQGSARFQVLEKSFPCKQVIGHWPAIDFALFEISVSALDEPLMLAIGQSFQFDRPLVAGQALLTMGFGVAQNPGRRLVFNQDHDCKVFSGDFRFMSDPDEFNPGSYQAWSFANGCDVSHGDSGSAMVDRDTGEIIGIIWTGRIPKSREAQSSAILGEWLRTQDPQIWTQMSYAVPASKIREVLQEFLDRSSNVPSETAEVIGAFLHL